MSSLVEELQRDALNSSVSVGDLLRKALVVASKLDLSDFRAWVESELLGYDDGDVPSYRIMRGKVMAMNPAVGYIPVRFIDAKTERTYATHYHKGAVGVVEALLARDSRGETFGIDFPPEVQHNLMQDDPDPMSTQVQVTRSHLVKVVESVRNAVLEWSLKLEQEGIVGDGMSFSGNERQIAKESADELRPINFIQIHHMENSSIQQASPQANQ